ncbi:MAG TPA: hypothetical protein VFA53_12340 [Xanthobacteraceae bacterium]|nr:hypothetical protein [Xanthobacteraceae bacterium]
MPIRTHIHILSAAAIVAAGAIAAVLGLSPIALAQQNTFSFALWGDMPYAKDKDEPKIPALIADMNASDIAFSIYDGDIKDGSSKCTDDVFPSAIKMFNSLKKPAVYVPGDNEWTDCHRLNNGGYNNLERLDHLRKTMFAKPESFGMETMPLEHQAKPGEKFSENVMFSRGGVMFVGLNIPGSNNNKVLDEKDCTKKSGRKGDQCDADNAEYQERDAANIAWMHEAFEKAKADKAVGIVLAFQGDPGFDVPETYDVNERVSPEYSGYTAFLDAVVKETGAYSGQVVLVHGDTHFFKVDKPLIDQAHLVPNLTRVQTFGSPNIHWVKVTVDPTSRDVFSFHPMIVEANK